MSPGNGIDITHGGHTMTSAKFVTLQIASQHVKKTYSGDSVSTVRVALPLQTPETNSTGCTEFRTTCRPTWGLSFSYGQHFSVWPALQTLWKKMPWKKWRNRKINFLAGIFCRLHLHGQKKETRMWVWNIACILLDQCLLFKTHTLTSV